MLRAPIQPKRVLLDAGAGWSVLPLRPPGARRPDRRAALAPSPAQAVPVAEGMR